MLQLQRKLVKIHKNILLKMKFIQELMDKQAKSKEEKINQQKSTLIESESK